MKSFIVDALKGWVFFHTNLVAGILIVGSLFCFWTADKIWLKK